VALVLLKSKSRVVVFPKEVADKWEDIERKISIYVPITITKPYTERIRAKTLSLSFPSLAIWGVPGSCSPMQAHPSWY